MLIEKNNRKYQSKSDDDNIITQKSSENQLEKSKSQIKNEKECTSQQLFEEQDSNLLKQIESNLIVSLNQSGEDIIKYEENKEKTEKKEEVFKKKENDFQKKKEKIKIKGGFKNIKKINKKRKEKKNNINACLSKKFKKQKKEHFNLETLEINEAIQKFRKTSHQNVKELPKSIITINIRDKTTIKKSSKNIEQSTIHNTQNNINNANNVTNVNNINNIRNVANMTNVNNVNNNINNINNVINVVNVFNLNNINNVNFNNLNDFSLLLNNCDINEDDILNIETISKICTNSPNRP